MDINRKQSIVLERIKTIYDVNKVYIDDYGELVIEYCLVGKDDTKFNVNIDGHVFDFYGLKRKFLSFGDEICFFGDFCYDKVFKTIYVFDLNEIVLVLQCPRKKNKHGYFCKCEVVNVTADINTYLMLSIKDICVSPKKNQIVFFARETSGVLVGYLWSDIKHPPKKFQLKQQHEFWYLDKKGGRFIFPVGGGYYTSVRDAISAAVRRKIQDFSVVEIKPSKYVLHVV